MAKRMHTQKPDKKPQVLPQWGWGLVFLLVAAVGLIAWRSIGTVLPWSQQKDQGTPARQRLIRVHVGGSVLNPGVYELPAGSRVQDAVEIAGGGTVQADLHAINLAKFLKDGDGVQVPKIKISPTAGIDQVPKVDINLAGTDELMQVPGFNQSMAENIVQFREEYGAFESLDQLLWIKGFGEKKLEDVRPYLELN